MFESRTTGTAWLLGGVLLGIASSALVGWAARPGPDPEERFRRRVLSAALEDQPGARSFLNRLNWEAPELLSELLGQELSEEHPPPTWVMEELEEQPWMGTELVERLERLEACEEPEPAQGRWSRLPDFEEFELEDELEDEPRPQRRR